MILIKIKLLNAIFMVDKIFTGEFKWYKLINDTYKLLRSKSNEKNQT